MNEWYKQYVERTYQSQLKVALPNCQLQRIHLNDLFKVNARKARQRNFDEHGGHAHGHDGILVVCLPQQIVVGLAPNGFAEQEYAKQERHERPPLGGAVRAVQKEGGKGRRGENLALRENGKHARANVAQRDKAQYVHGAVDQGEADHFARILHQIAHAVCEYYYLCRCGGGGG